MSLVATFRVLYRARLSIEREGCMKSRVYLFQLVPLRVAPVDYFEVEAPPLVREPDPPANDELALTDGVEGDPAPSVDAFPFPFPAGATGPRVSSSIFS